MQSPHSLINEGVVRKAHAANTSNNDLILKEAVLRKLAYKNSTILTPESFFDDSDMQSEYYLVIIYDKQSGVPLLSCRYYYSHEVIEKCLKGDENFQGTEHAIDLKQYGPCEIFLADRLSGNINNVIYRHCRKYIFLLFFAEIFRHNRNRKFILMARHERQNKLLKKYLKLGLAKVGSTSHKGKQHWILIGDTRKSFLRLNWMSRIFLSVKGTIVNRK